MLSSRSRPPASGTDRDLLASQGPETDRGPALTAWGLLRSWGSSSRGRGGSHRRWPPCIQCPLAKRVVRDIFPSLNGGAGLWPGAVWAQPSQPEEDIVMWTGRAAIGSVVGAGVLITAIAVAQTPNRADVGGEVARNAQRMLVEGKQIFRYDTFGDEVFWGDALQLHKAIAGSANGGVGGGVSPKTALSVGLKVDAEALPKDLVAGIKAGKVNLDDPATTLALLKLNSVTGLKATFEKDGRLKSIGI